MDREGHNGVNYFVGTEVERTPAHGLKTLFVVGSSYQDRGHGMNLPRF